MLSGSPSIPVIGLQGTFVAAGMLTIGGSTLQGNSAPSGGGIFSGVGTVNVADAASATNSATGTGAAGGVATNSATSAGGAVATTSSPATISAGNPTTTAGNPTTTAGNPTTSANPGTTTNAASGSNSGSTGGGIPVLIGELTLVNGTAATSSTASGGLTAAAPVPGIFESVATNFAGLLGAVAGAKVADIISTVSTTIAAQNTQETSPVAKAGDLVASAGGSVSASSSLIGTSGSSSLVNGQNGNPGVGASLSTIASASTATITNPAPNSIYLDTDQIFSKPETITSDPLPGSRELPGSTVPEAVGTKAPAEAMGKAGGEIDIDIDLDFDVEAFSTDHAVSAPLSEPTLISVSAATGSRVDGAEIGQVTTTGSALPIDLAHDGNARSNVGELVILTSMLATYSANLAFGGAISNYGTMSWAAQHWPATRRSKGIKRPSPMLRFRNR